MKKKVIIVIVLLIIAFGGGFVAYKILSKDNKDIKNIFNSTKYDEYKSGDRVKFNGTEWYVMYDSSSKENSMTLISADILFLGDQDINYVSNGIYETSDINKYLKEEYVNELGSDNFVEKNGYKVRLLNKDDIDKLTKYEYDEDNDSYNFTDCPEFICSINSFYGTMIDTNENFEKIDVYNNIDDIENIETDEYELHLKYYNLTGTIDEFKLESVVNDATLFVRPVVNVYKSSIE